jgi:hypothetical protein
MGLGPMEVKCIFFTTPEAELFSKSKEKEVGEKTETKRGHWCDRMRSWHD